MANSDKNIVITPNTGQAATPTIVFTGGSNTPGTLTVNDAGTLSFDKQLISSVATGTAPFAVSSTTRVANLNVATAGTSDSATSAGFITNTNIGKTGSQGFISTVAWTSQSWADQPISGLGMTVNNTPGAPTANYGFFSKFGNRDAGGPGWGGLWMEYDGGSLHYGATVLSSTNATWKRVLDSGNYNTYSPTLTGTGASGTWGIAISGNAATATTATTATTANALNTANSYTGVNFTATGSLVVGTSGTYVAGSLYSDANWGMIFRAKQASPAIAQFMWTNSAGTELFRFNGSALTTSVTGNAATVTNGVYTTGNQSIAGTTNLNVLSIGGKIVAGPLGGNGSTNAGANALLGLYNSRGRKLYLDEEFRSGTNSVSVYNNFGGTAVTITRKNTGFLDGHTQPPNGSGFVLEIRHAPLESLGKTPGYGGWYFGVSAAAGKTFICKFKMKVQVGRELVFASNSIGAGGSQGWLTNTAGTGNYEDYAYYVTSGTSGWSSTFFFYVSGGSNAVFYTYLASATVYEVTSLSGEGFYSIGVGTEPSGTLGEIRATNDVTAYYSDARLKTFVGKIDNPLEKISRLNGYYFYENELAKSLGYTNDSRQIGLSAQEVQEILPEIVVPAPIDSTYLTVKYEKIAPLFVEAIKEQQTQITELKNQIDALQNILNTLIGK